MPLKRLKTPIFLWWWKFTPHRWKYFCVFEDTRTRSGLVKDTAKFGAEMFTFFVGDTARHGHGHGKTTPVFDRGETASLFGIVIPLSYLCIVMEMARQTNKGKARQVSSKTQSLTEIFGEVLSRTHRNDADASRQKQGKDLPFHNCGRFTVLFGIVIPLSYLCIVELKTNKN
jgi:hypothetical protein